MRFLRYSLRRLVFLVPQLVAVSLIVFFLVRLLPGDPAYLIAGQFATKERIEEVRRDLGLDRPLPVQYVTYVGRVLRGDLGRSWRTSQSVVEDIRSRLPATLELILSAGLISVVLGIPIGVYTAVKRRGVGDKVLFVYGMLSGSIPDFWLGLILIFVFFSLLGWLPGPIGRLDPILAEPAPREYRFDENGAPQQEPEHDADDGDHRRQGVVQRIAQLLAAWQAERPRMLDEIRPQHFLDGRARVLDDQCHIDEDERRYGQHEVPERRNEAVPVAGDQRVYRVHAGHGRRRLGDGVEAADRARQPAEQREEHENEDEAEPEIRNRA